MLFLHQLDLYGNFIKNQEFFSYSNNIVSYSKSSYTVFASSKNTCRFIYSAFSHFSFLLDSDNNLYDCDYLDVIWISNTEFFLIGLYSKIYFTN